MSLKVKLVTINISACAEYSVELQTRAINAPQESHIENLSLQGRINIMTVGFGSACSVRIERPHCGLTSASIICQMLNYELRLHLTDKDLEQACDL